MLLYLMIPLVVLFTRINAECPDINDMPVLNENGDQFYCAFNWYEDEDPWDNDIPLEACNGNYEDFMDGFDFTTNSDGVFRPFGGIIVKAGCTLYGYYYADYEGDHYDYEG